MDRVFVVGRRKTAKARAVLTAGNGALTINKESLECWPLLPRKIIETPLILAKNLSKKVDIKIRVYGGGIIGQAEACALAIATGLVEYFKDENLKNLFLNYNRNLLVEDFRRTEPHKPSQSSKGPRHKKQKSYR
jgi:small subunit ribosomal protein S9